MIFFVKLIKGDDTILKWNAIEVLSNLTEVDTESKFNTKLLNKYILLLNDESMVTAANTITALGKVALNKPQFRKKITSELVKVDTLPHSPECRNILAGKAIEAFGLYVDELKDKPARLTRSGGKEIKLFAEKHLKNRRNATRKKVKDLLVRIALERITF